MMARKKNEERKAMTGKLEKVITTAEKFEKVTIDRNNASLEIEPGKPWCGTEPHPFPHPTGGGDDPPPCGNEPRPIRNPKHSIKVTAQPKPQDFQKTIDKPKK